MFRSVMSHKVWLMVRRGFEVEIVEETEALECGIEFWVRLKGARKQPPVPNRPWQTFASRNSSVTY